MVHREWRGGVEIKLQNNMLNRQANNNNDGFAHKTNILLYIAASFILPSSFFPFFFAFGLEFAQPADCEWRYNKTNGRSNVDGSCENHV